MKQGTKAWAKFVFGQEMIPCPKCKSYNLISQTPIKMDVTDDDLKDSRKLLGKWARATKSGHTPLKGPVFMMCRDCGHKGPSIDCTGRTSEDVGKDPIVSKTIKKLWNNQNG